MTIADLYQVVVDGGSRTLAIIVLLPLVLGVVSFYLKAGGMKRASQAVANFNIALGLAALSIEILALAYAMDRLGTEPLSEVPLMMLFGPVYLLVAAILVENRIHPGPQEEIRRRLRGAVLTVIAMVVIYYVLVKLQIHMLVWTNLVGFLVFIVILIAALYYVARRYI